MALKIMAERYYVECHFMLSVIYADRRYAECRGAFLLVANVLAHCARAGIPLCAVDHLIKKGYFVIKEKYSFSIKSSCSELVSTGRSTVLIRPLQ